MWFEYSNCMATCEFQQRTDQVIEQLNELFGNTINLDIIRRVASSCKFDVHLSTNQLIEMSNQSSPLSGPPFQKMTTVSNEKKSKKTKEIEDALKKINSGYKVMILLRGLPGSGKSTLAKTILAQTVGYEPQSARNHILSTDDFFMKNGVYQYDPNRLSEAHGYNHQRAFNVMSKGYSPVIIDNTNCLMWEMKPYAIMATDFGYYLEILEPDTHWCYDEKELFKRNTHRVQKSSIKNMKERFERHVTPIKLLAAYGCEYKHLKPPQFRLMPSIQNEINMTSFSFNNPKPVSSTQHFHPSNSQNIEKVTVNLMDFTEPPPIFSEQTFKRHDNGRSRSENNVSIDKMLMNSESDQNVKTLKPTLSSTMKQSTSLFDGIQNAWGVDERALRSWEIVTPLCETVCDGLEIIDIDDCEQAVETRDTSTSTDDMDFFAIRKDGTFSGCQEYKILTTCNRDINRNVPIRPQGVRRKLMLDKSCLTEDYFDDQNVHVDQLTHLFPNIAVKTLKYWYNKCNRDFECTIEWLLAEQEKIIEIDLDEPETVDVHETIVLDSDSSSSSISESSGAIPKIDKNKRKTNSPPSEELEKLKKCLESKVHIGNDHYSEKLLKVKTSKFGPPLFFNEQTSSTSSALKSKYSTDECCSRNISENHVEFDDTEWEDIQPDQNQNDEVELVELNLGDHFVTQLENKFGDPNLLYPKGFQPVVEIPVTLARQIYTFYIESVYQQMDAQKSVMEELMKEDEEFARNLQAAEENYAKIIDHQKINESNPTEIPDIIREQKQLSKWQKEVDKWKELTPDTLAARLTKEKLFAAFPSLDKDTLVEILQAHNNVYADTVDTLLASTNMADVRGQIDNIKDPPFNDSTITEMWEAHRSCTIAKITNENGSAADYRKEADQFLKKRSDLYEKARKYYQSGMKEVAQFYSGLAAQQTRLFEQANGYAALAFIDEHSKRLQDFNTLDLHFLYVKEALPSLDMFLDRNINLLRLSPSKHTELLQIITGRGKHSEGGASKIRPAVISRLKQRKINYTLQNQGMVRIRITKNTAVTNEL